MNNMEWYAISIITLLIYWLIGLIIYLIKDKESFLLYWAVGFVYPLTYIILYPVRIFNKYKGSIKYYEKYNVSYWDMLFGKVVYEGEVMWRWQASKRKKEVQDE